MGLIVVFLLLGFSVTCVMSMREVSVFLLLLSQVFVSVGSRVLWKGRRGRLFSNAVLLCAFGLLLFLTNVCSFSSGEGNCAICFALFLTSVSLRFAFFVALRGLL